MSNEQHEEEKAEMRIFLQISRLCPLSALPKYDPEVRVAILRISCLQLKLVTEALADDGRAVSGWAKVQSQSHASG